MKFTNPKNLDPAFLAKVINTGFKLSVLVGVDPNVNNLVAAGTFCSTSKQVQDKSLCFVRSLIGVCVGGVLAAHRDKSRRGHGACNDSHVPRWRH